MWPFGDDNAAAGPAQNQEEPELSAAINKVNNALRAAKIPPRPQSMGGPPPFTKQDEVRLKHLQQERKRKHKKARIKAFMDLPPDVREEILVSARTCKFASLLQQEAPLTDEEDALLRKQSHHHGYVEIGNNQPYIHLGNDRMQVWMDQVNGLTLEDLEHAHAGEELDKILSGTDTDTKD